MKKARFTVPGRYQMCIYIYTLTIHDHVGKSVLPAVQKPLCSFPVEKDTGGQGPLGEGERKAIARKSDTLDEKKITPLCCLRNRFATSTGKEPSI